MTTPQHDDFADQAPFTVERIEGDLMAVNSFLVHGPEGVVIVDGQLTVADAEKVAAAVRASGRPLAGVLITHPHPDHYAGVGVISRDVPIFATERVDAVIRRDDEEKSSIVGAMMDEQWPAHRRFPDVLVAVGGWVDLGGLRFRVTDSGPGESHADNLWWVDRRTVFAGDLAYNDMHCYLADANSSAWVEAICALEAQLPPDATLHVGHGRPAGREVLAAQRRYIQVFLAAVAEHAAENPEARRAAVVDHMRATVGDDRLLFLMELSIEPVHRVLAGSDA